MAVAAILDLDGTLVTFNLDMKEWRKVLLDILGRRGFSTERLTLTTPTQDILDAARSQASSDDRLSYDLLRAEAFSTLDRLEFASVANATVIPGAVEAVQLLKSKGVRLCVVTNSGRKAASESLKKSGLSSYFEFVLTRDDTETMKPRPEGLIKAVSMMGLGPADVYYVGDSPYDIAAARGAGVKSVSVPTGNYSLERLRADGADFVIASISELPRVLGV